MKPSTETLQYLFKKGNENVKFLLGMIEIPRRTIYDNLKKFKLQDNLTSKKEVVAESNSIQMTAEISKHSNGQ